MENHKGNFLMLIISVTLLLIGYVVFTSIVGQIDGTNDYNNATASNVSTVYGFVPMLVMVISIIFAVGLVSWYVSTPERYSMTNKYIVKLLEFLDKTTHYFAFGIFAYATFGSIAVATYLIYRLSMYAGETGVGIDILKWVGIIVLFYFGTAFIGYLFKKYFWNKYKKRKEERERLSIIEELPRGSM